MKVSDFIEKADFNEMLTKVASEECFDYEKNHREKGNSYRFSIRGCFDYKNSYRIFPSFDYNYKDEKYGRQVGGGSLIVNCSNWDSFKQDFEKRLQEYPDYEETEQISLF